MPRKKILWLCSWYPNKTEPFNGDFIQRHARAAALFNDIHVLHLAAVSSPDLFFPETGLQNNDGLTEQIIYYRKGRSAWGRFRAYYRWLFLYRKAIRNYIDRHGKPELVHVQVPLKAGILALWLLRRYRVPYLVTEHWGIYNDVAEDKYDNRSRAFKYFTRQVIEKAVKFISVSRYLAEGINRLVIKKDFNVVPNVVDTRLFYYTQRIASPFRFIHVSNMVPLKNAEGILRSFAALRRQHGNAELVMVGDTEPTIRNISITLGLPETAVIFRGEVAYEMVAREMQDSNCLVLFSNIENSPCVIGEALCCGLPVIATKAGGIPELIDTNNSILVAPMDDEALTSAMMEMINTFNRYDRKAIAEKAAQQFSYNVVGNQLDRLYEKAAAGNP